MTEGNKKNRNNQFIDRLRTAYDAGVFDNLDNYEYQGLFGASKIYNIVANYECAEKYKQLKKDAETNSNAAKFVNKYEDECIKKYATKMNEYVSQNDFQITLSNEAIERLTGEKLSDDNEVSNTLSAKEVMDAHHDLSVEMYNKAHPLPMPEKSGLSDLGNKQQMTNLDADFIKTIKKIDNDISHANFRIHQNFNIPSEYWDKIEKEDCKDKEYLAEIEEDYYGEFKEDKSSFDASELLPSSEITTQKSENGNEYAAYILSHDAAKQAQSQTTYDGTEKDIDETKVYSVQNVRNTADKLLALHAKGKDKKAEQILPDFKENYGEIIEVKDKNISITAESYVDLCNDVSEQLNDNLNNNPTVIKSRENQYQYSSYQKIMSSSDNELLEDKTDLNLIMIAEAGSRAKAKITKNPQILDGLSDTEKENIKFNVNALSTLKESLREEPYLKTDSDFQHRMNYVENLSDEELSKGLNQIEKSVEVQKSLNDEKIIQQI